MSGIQQRWNRLRRRCASFKTVSGGATLDADASFILNETTPGYAVAAKESRHQRAASMTPTSSSSSSSSDAKRQYSWRKSHSVEKYDVRDVNLNQSLGEKGVKEIRLPPDYWKVHEHDVKVWKIGTGTPTRPHRTHNRDALPKSNDCEFNTQRYDEINDSKSKRIQYFTGTDGNGNRKNSLESDRKEVKFPGLKAFKSASVRLPGQKSSIHEMQQLLRSKFNRLNVGLRKKRTMSVQEVFDSPSSQQQQQQNLKQTLRSPPTQFYVPSPNGGGDDDTTGPSSLPFCFTPMNDSSQNVAVVSVSATTSPIQETKRDIDSRKAITRSQSYRTRPRTENGALSATKSSATRVSLREQSLPSSSSAKPSTATRIGNAVRDRIRMRPRSHSPAKPLQQRSNSVREKSKKGRGEAFGFFDRINRMMNTNPLPPTSSTTNNNNHSVNNMNRPTKTNETDSTAIESGTSSSMALATTAATTVAPQAAPRNRKSTINRTCDFEQTKSQPQSPEAIFIRDRKVSKQVK